MDWLNIHTAFLDSEAFLGAEPTDRATWLCLLRYCCGQENSGTIIGAKEWGDRKWQQLVRVTLKEVSRATKMWRWEGDDLQVEAYPITQQEVVKTNRKNGTIGGHSKTQAKTEAARTNGSLGGRPKNPSENPSENRTEGKSKGKEERETPARALLGSFFLDTKEKPMGEWKILAEVDAGCTTTKEILAFLKWSITAARESGRKVEYARHCIPEAITWKREIRINRGFSVKASA